MRVVVALALLLALAGSARANLALDTYRLHETDLPEAPPGGRVLASVPFHLDQPGQFFAKLLVTPQNPVNNGTPNGTVAPDGSAGLTGWWVDFHLADASGAPVVVDALGNPVNASLGAYVDSTPTPPLALEPGASYTLYAAIHVPPEAVQPGVEHRVSFALVYREGAYAEDAASGGRLEQSRAFTEVIRFDSGAAPGSGAVGGNPSSGSPGGSSNGTTTNDTAPGSQQEPTGSAPILVTADPALLGAWLWVPLALSIAALLVASAALAVTAYALLLTRRELRALREARAGEVEQKARMR